MGTWSFACGRWACVCVVGGRGAGGKGACSFVCVGMFFVSMGMRAEACVFVGGGKGKEEGACCQILDEVV